jgi:serine protease
MKRPLTISIVLLACAASLFAGETPRKRYLVGTWGPAMKSAIPARVEADLDAAVQRFQSVDGFAAELTDEQVEILRKSPSVAFIEADPVKRALEVESDGGFPSTDAQARNRKGQTLPFGIDMVKANQLWSLASGATIRVAVIDSGIDPHHPDLAANFRGGRDFVEDDDIPNDENGHGTHVAGTIGAVDNDFGVVGIAPNVELFSLRVLDEGGSGSTADVILAVDWAIAHDIDVLNLSLGSDASSVLEERAFERAQQAGILVFAASGNCFTSCEGFPNGIKTAVDFPAGYPTVVAVGAIDSLSSVASFSQRGNSLKLVAPGVGVLSAAPTGSGTIADVELLNGSFVEADGFTGSPLRDVQGDYVYVGRGRVEDMSSAVAGKIALMERDADSIPDDARMTFNEKVKNAKAAGAIGAIIMNCSGNSTRCSGPVAGTLIGTTCAPNQCDDPADVAFDWPVTVGITNLDGQALRANSGRVTVSNRSDDYVEQQGTSMSTPHVAGVAALLWSLAPNATMEQVRDAMLNTAVDLGGAGFDTTFGFGLVDALAAGKRLAPEKFSTVPARRVRRR